MQSLRLLQILTLGLAVSCGDDDDTAADSVSDSTTDATISPEDCFDGQDNDGDSLVDCNDNDCLEACSEDCTDGIDNDGDSHVDCDDFDCASTCTEDCDDGIDNDSDDLADCDDPDCTTLCPEIDCSDGIDNDKDGNADCEDYDCTDQCPEFCENDSDDDADGNIDCSDTECWGQGDCLGRYNIKMTISETDIYWVWGGPSFPVIPILFELTAIGNLDIEMTPTPDWDGNVINCNGYFHVSSDVYSGQYESGYPSGLIFDYDAEPADYVVSGSLETFDYFFRFEPNLGSEGDPVISGEPFTPQSLFLEEGCPIATLAGAEITWGATSDLPLIAFIEGQSQNGVLQPTAVLNGAGGIPVEGEDCLPKITNWTGFY